MTTGIRTCSNDIERLTRSHLDHCIHRCCSTYSKTTVLITSRRAASLFGVGILNYLGKGDRSMKVLNMTQAGLIGRKSFADLWLGLVAFGIKTTSARFEEYNTSLSEIQF